MCFTINGGLYKAAYEGAYGSRAAYNHEEGLQGIVLLVTHFCITVIRTKLYIISSRKLFK